MAYKSTGCQLCWNPVIYSIFSNGGGFIMLTKREVLDLAVDLDIINKSGSWFSYEGQRLGQGRDNIKELLQNTPQLMQEVEEKIKKKLAEQKAAAVKAAEQKRNGRKPAESNNALEQAAEQAAAAQMQQANLNALDMESDADLDIAAETDFSEFEPTE